MWRSAVAGGEVRLPEVLGVDPVTVRMISYAIDSEGDFDPALYAHLCESETLHAVTLLTVLKAHGETRKIFNGFAEHATQRWEAAKPKR